MDTNPSTDSFKDIKKGQASTLSHGKVNMEIRLMMN
jgi:hypothetical protein